MSMSEIKDLRKTNFKMGCECEGADKDALSVYYRDYRPWELPDWDAKAQTFKFQKTNLSLGDNHHPGRWASTQNKDFVKHEYQAPSRLNEEKKQDLRTHHFNFGDWNGTKVSEFEDEYTKKRAEVDFKNGEQLKNKLRKHNFELGDHSKKMANSVYDTTFVPHPVDQFAAPNKEELKRKVVELRNTNLVLGQDANNAGSTMKADYKKIEGFEPTILNRAQLQKTHFDMGSDPANHTSMNRTFFKAHRPDPNSTIEQEKRELIADLRRHHFDFGQSAADYGTDYKNNFVNHGPSTTAPIDPNLYRNHFTIGDNEAGFEQGSVYMRDMKKFDPEIYKQAATNINSGRDKASNWDFGAFDNNWQSEAKTHFIPKDLPEKVNNDKSGKATYDFKEHEKLPMVTEFQDNYRNRFDPNAIGKMDLKLLQDLRSIHYDIKDDENFRGVSEYRENFIKQQAGQSYGQTISDNKLRKGNFKIGELPGDYRTIYRDKYKYPPNNY